MWKSLPSILFLLLFSSCNENTVESQSQDSMIDTSVQQINVPTFDISGKFEVRLNSDTLNIISVNGEPDLSLKNVSEKDTLYISYNSAIPCEECRLETQIWVAGKYTDLVRDTGYGVGAPTKIPCSLLLKDSKYGTSDYSPIALFLSVRQFHPVETGNKRFLFYIELE
jgi:hypothetical protein